MCRFTGLRKARQLDRELYDEYVAALLASEEEKQLAARREEAKQQCEADEMYISKLVAEMQLEEVKAKQKYDKIAAKDAKLAAKLQEEEDKKRKEEAEKQHTLIHPQAIHRTNNKQESNHWYTYKHINYNDKSDHTMTRTKH